MAAHADPARLRAARGFDGAVDVGGSRLRHLRQFGLPSAGLKERRSRRRSLHCVVDEQAETAAMLVQPRLRFLGAFGCGAVIHSLKNLFNSWHDESVRI
jgi:hypothetical protein